MHGRATGSTCERFGSGPKRIVYLGMNPGPVRHDADRRAVRRSGRGARLDGHRGATIARPRASIPKRPIEGFDCPRSEVSGRRLWGWAALRYGSAESFFADAFVLNYCPLVFLEAVLPQPHARAVAGRGIAPALRRLRPAPGRFGRRRCNPTG